MEQKNQLREMDVCLYIVSLALAAFRFSRGMNPFDLNDEAVAEYLMAKCLPFIKNENIKYQVAHEEFLSSLYDYDWQYGTKENIHNRIHPDLLQWHQLDKEGQALYAFIAGLLSSARNFLSSLETEIETEILDNISSSVNGAIVTSKTKTIIN